jgi:hypothetical protein
MATSAMDPNRGATASHEPEEASGFRAFARILVPLKWRPLKNKEMGGAPALNGRCSIA